MALQPLFNPSNDMALAANVRQYFPPRRIRQMESDLASLARLWPEGPWGWSLATKQRYLALGVGREELPSDEWLHEVRRLSSRQFGVAYYQAMDGLMASDEAGSALLPCRARYCSTMGELAAALEACPVSIIKAPWSSSGRGNMVVGRSDEGCDGASQRGRLSEAERQRAEGLIRQQGGLVVEPFYADKALDFAMEFEVADGAARFLGYSVFSADEMGHYCGNLVESQESLLRHIVLPASLLQQLADYHCRQLATLSYRGPVGIDMMRLRDGRIHPCVEINFRMTMGLLALRLQQSGTIADQLLAGNERQGFAARIVGRRLVIEYNK